MVKQRIADNPFHPQFGKRPDKFIGRDNIIRDFGYALENPNSPLRTMVLSGIRGSGKTALLSGIKESVDTKRFAIVDVTAGANLLQSILDQLQLQLTANKRKLTGASIGALGFSLGLQTQLEPAAHGFRYYLTLLVAEVAQKNKGIVFLIGELHASDSELREFITSYQHLLRDGTDIALVAAGLPNAVNSVLNDKILTFLHRSHKVKLDSVDVRLVEHLYVTTFQVGGFSVDDNLLKSLAQASYGFPYLIQLLGYYVWKDSSATISYNDYKSALLNSQIELSHNVHQLIYAELSSGDKRFLAAMCDIAKVNKTNEVSFNQIIENLGVTSGFGSKYRQRLIQAELIEPTKRGFIHIKQPYFSDFLVDQEI